MSDFASFMRVEMNEKQRYAAQKRITSAERKAAALARNRYLHVSVLVGMGEIEVDGVKIPVPTRTPKGKGGTARKRPEVAKIINAGRHRRELRRAARSAD